MFSGSVIRNAENTNFKFLKEGEAVNLEFDILGKYIKKILKG